MNHETHIQPKQAKKSPQIRFPCSYEDSGRPQGHSPSPQSWQKRISCLSSNASSSDPCLPDNSLQALEDRKNKFTLPQTLKLKKTFEFSAIFREKNRFVGKYLCIDIRKAKTFRFGITASKKYGDAVDRNRFKRCVREAIRLSLDLLPKTLEMNISPRQLAKTAKMQEIQNEILRLLCKE